MWSKCVTLHVAAHHRNNTNCTAAVSMSWNATCATTYLGLLKEKRNLRPEINALIMGGARTAHARNAIITISGTPKTSHHQHRMQPP